MRGNSSPLSHGEGTSWELPRKAPPFARGEQRMFTSKIGMHTRCGIFASTLSHEQALWQPMLYMVSCSLRSFWCWMLFRRILRARLTLAESFERQAACYDALHYVLPLQSKVRHHSSTISGQKMPGGKAYSTALKDLHAQKAFKLHFPKEPTIVSPELQGCGAIENQPTIAGRARHIRRCQS